MDKIKKIKGIIQPIDLSILETTGSSNNIVGRDDKGRFGYKVSDYDISYNFKQETDFFIDKFGLDYTNVGGITNWSFLGTVVGSGLNTTLPNSTGGTTITINTSSFTTTLNNSTLTITQLIAGNFNTNTASMCWTSSLIPLFDPGTSLSASLKAGQIYQIDIPYNSLVDDGINVNQSFNNIVAGAYRTPNWTSLYTTTTSSNSTRDRFYITSSVFPKSRTFPAFTQIVAGPRIRMFISGTAAEITSSFITTQTTNFNYERNNDYWGVVNYSPLHQTTAQQDNLQRGLWIFSGTARNARTQSAGIIYLPTSSNDSTYYTAVGSRTAFTPKFNTTYEMETLLYLAPPPLASGAPTGYNTTASNDYRWGFFFGLANKEMMGGSGWSPLYTNSSSAVDVTQFPNFAFPLSENQFTYNTSSFGTNFAFSNANSGTGKIIGRGIGPNNLLGFLYGGLSNNVTSSFNISTPSEQVWGLKALAKGYNLSVGGALNPNLMTSSLVPLTSSVSYPFVGGKTYSLKLKYTIGAFVPNTTANTVPFTVDWFVNGSLVYTITTNLNNSTAYATEQALITALNNSTALVNNSIPNLFTSYANLTPCFYMATLSGSNNYVTKPSPGTTNSFRPTVAIDYIKTRIYPSDASDRSGDTISIFV